MVMAFNFATSSEAFFNCSSEIKITDVFSRIFSSFLKKLG